MNINWRVLHFYVNFQCDVLQQMHTKGWEELSSVREEKRKLEIDIENLKLQLKLQIGQWESKVKWK